MCLHGYGESGAHFSFLEKELALSEYRFLAPDLPWHGDTTWKEGLDWEPEGFASLIHEMLAAERIDVGNGIIIIGFSLGGRLALDYFQQQHLPVKKLVLLAPDGLKVNFWYWLSTQTWPGRKLFKLTMNKPGWFFGLLKTGNRLGLVNTSIFKFVKYYIGDAPARQLLYNRWVTLRRFKPDLKRCRSLIREQEIPVRIVYGKHDRIILPVRGKKFQQGLEKQITLTEIESGHQVLHEKHAAEISDALLQ